MRRTSGRLLEWIIGRRVATDLDGRVDNSSVYCTQFFHNYATDGHRCQHHTTSSLRVCVCVIYCKRFMHETRRDYKPALTAVAAAIAIVSQWSSQLNDVCLWHRQTDCCTAQTDIHSNPQWTSQSITQPSPSTYSAHIANPSMFAHYKLWKFHEWLQITHFWLQTLFWIIIIAIAST